MRISFVESRCRKLLLRQMYYKCLQLQKSCNIIKSFTGLRQYKYNAKSSKEFLRKFLNNQRRPMKYPRKIYSFLSFLCTPGLISLKYQFLKELNRFLLEFERVHPNKYLPGRGWSKMSRALVKNNLQHTLTGPYRVCRK